MSDTLSAPFLCKLANKSQFYCSSSIELGNKSFATQGDSVLKYRKVWCYKNTSVYYKSVGLLPTHNTVFES